MSANDFWDLVNKYKKKQNNQNSRTQRTQTITVNRSDNSATDEFWSMVDQYKKEQEQLRPSDYGIKTTIDDDIAPVKKKEEEDDSLLDFFQKGALGKIDVGQHFDDGYQFGDIGKAGGNVIGNVSKAILGTVGDAGLGAVKGAAKLGEGVGDLISYGVAGVADLAGKDAFAERVKRNTQKSAIDELTKGADDYLDQYSMLGRTSDNIAEGAGQVAAILALAKLGGALGLGSAGTSVLTSATRGLSSMGSGMSEAYQSFATDGEAVAYGAIAGTADALTELLFGGLGKAVNATGLSYGLSSADDMLAKKVSGLFQSQIAKNLSEFGIKAGAEGFEEVLAGVAQAIGKRFTYLKDEAEAGETDFLEILKDENLLEQFVVGSVVSGFAQVPGLNVANKTNTDFVTGLSQDERDVLKKVTEQRIAEAEAEGKTLTKKEKVAIEAEVEQDMEKGYISTDTIEEVLGGDSYKAYQDTIRQESDALAELAQLYEGDELKQRSEEFLKGSKRGEMAQSLSESVFDRVKDSRLGESYRDKARRGQKFTADVSKYDEKQKVTVQRAIDSGVLNNTNRTHDMVDFIARVSADTGVLFDFTNNEKLRDSIFAVDGKTVDGYITENGITININSKKYLNTVVGHEITHALEGSKLYDTLQDTLFEYAKAKGDYKDRLKAAYDMYRGVDGYQGYEGLQKIKKEAVADLVGDYLFTDKDFVSHLSTKHQNIFQKVWNEIKYMVKVARAGSEEARKLLQVQKAFEEAYRNSGKNADTSASVVDQSMADSSMVDSDNAMQEDIVPDHSMVDPDNLLDMQEFEMTEAEAEAYENAEPVQQNTEKQTVSADTVHNWLQEDFKKAKKAHRDLKKFKDVNEYLASGVDYEEAAQTLNYIEDVFETDGSPYQLAGTPASGSILKDYMDYLKGAKKQGEAGGVQYALSKQTGTNFDGSTKYSLENGNKSKYNKRRKYNEAETLFLRWENGSAPVGEVKKFNRFGKTRYYEKTENGVVELSRSQYIERNGAYAENIDRRAERENGTAFDNDESTQRGSFGDHNSHRDGGGTAAVFGQALREELQDATRGSVRGVPGYDSGNIINQSEYAEEASDDSGASFITFSNDYAAIRNFMKDGDQEAKPDSDTRYSLSAEQEEYFRDSVVRDENGNLKVMYHGTPNGDFTIFKDGTYFTDNKAYADRYQNTGASSIRTGKVASSPKTFEVYLDIKKPFDISDPEARRIYIEDYIKGGNAMGINPYLSDAEYAKIKAIDWTEGEDLREFLIDNGYGYDGLVLDEGADGGYGDDVKSRGTSWVVFSPEQVKSVDNKNPSSDPDINLSLSNANDAPKRYGNWRISGEDVAYEDIAPAAETVSETESVAPEVSKMETTTEELFPDDLAPMSEDEADAHDRLWSIDEADAPPETEEGYEVTDVSSLNKTTVDNITRQVKAILGLGNRDTADVRSIVEAYSTSEVQSSEDLYYTLMERFGKYTKQSVDEDTKEVKALLRAYPINVTDDIKSGIADYGKVMRSNFGKVRFSKEGLPVDVAYLDLSEHYPGYFPENITNPTDQLLRIMEVANMDVQMSAEFDVDEATIAEAALVIARGVNAYKRRQNQVVSNRQAREAFNALMESPDQYVPPIPENVAPVRNTKPVQSDPDDIAPIFETSTGQQAFMPDAEVPAKLTRKELHSNIMANIHSKMAEKGINFDNVLRNAKNLPTFATVDNTPQRVMEKALGYKAGQALSDLTVDQVARNETDGIQWLNSYTDRKTGLLAQISKQYGIKPGSKASAAAQMYAEGFYVGKNDAIIEYGDRELAIDFPDAKVRENIKGLARDPRIRQIYDETLAMINESRSRNAYPEIPRLDNYFLHFRAMEDTFSQLGLPFNPNDIRAKDLPTDLNGVTADLKPGQPYFASAMHRTGKRTSFDLLGGLEKYLSSAKNQIYHIDDIQTLRALRNYIADTYGQAKGLESLDALSEEEAQERIEQVYGAHLSTFAKFLNEEANVIAGKTALIDRGLEGIIGRRGMTFLDTVNRQVGSNMVGFNVSSSLTNFLSVAQAFAKTNKYDFVKALAQTASNKVGSIFGKGDGFTEASPVAIRRKGAERFHRTPWQKAGDAGYVLMSAVDNISTEIIARAKYNELTRKGMDSQQAHMETDKWVSRMMGDRSLGQQPHLYNSKMLGIVTKFQLEVRNQLDSQFYDTIQEAKASNEDIQNGLARNAKTAAKVTSTFFQLAVAQHLFGKAFESIAGYNPAFDIISAIIKAFGWDDEEESEDTVLDNLEQGFLELLGDLPYTSTFTGGRIPISSALPIEQFVTGKDQYGNEKSRWETLAEAAPYYVLPGGYNQAKKTYQGLGMFDEDHPIAGSYTDSGNLRFPVADTIGNRVQAGIFGQWASDNARDYFNNERQPMKPNQIQEFIDVDIPIQDYWKYRDGLSGLTKLEEKADYIAGLDLPVDKKNILINNIADRKEPIDMSDYMQYSGFEEFDFAHKNPEKYGILQEQGVSYAQYKALDEKDRDAYGWAVENPESYLVSKAVTSDVVEYRRYTSALNDIKADKDEDGKTINGSRKEKVIDYINGLDADYGAKIVLYKSEYPSDDSYNNDILDYLNSREDLSFEEIATILKKLGFAVDSKGNVTW